MLGISSIDFLTSLTIILIKVDREEESRTIKHFNMISWPDMSVPHPTSILNLVQTVKDMYSKMQTHNSNDADVPILVHCR